MNRKTVIYKCSLYSIIANIGLSIIKLLLGIIGHSKALISDSIHSISDVFTTIIVIIGNKISNRESDKSHPYGHDRFECVFSIILSIVLCFTGIIIGYKAVKLVLNGNYNDLITPSFITLVVAGFSIIIKELMYWYTIKYANIINSTSLKADAHHHRSDAISSIGSLIGILGSRLGFSILDSIASIIICLMIIKTSINIFLESMNQMVDRSCDEESISKYIYEIKKVKGVIKIDLIKTRLFGSKVYIDIEISVDAKLSLIKAHNIAEKIHNKLENKFSEIKHIMIHVNPYNTKTK